MFFKKKSRGDSGSDQKANVSAGKEKTGEMAAKNADEAKVVAGNTKLKKAQLALIRRRALGLGQIVSILMRNKATAEMPLSQVATFLQPALKTGQYMIAEMPAKAGGTPLPAAFLIWARVSPAVDAKLSKGGSLADADWSSGDIPWLMLAAGKKDVVGKLVAAVEKQAFGGARMKVYGPAKPAGAKTAS